MRDFLRRLASRPHLPRAFNQRCTGPCSGYHRCCRPGGRQSRNSDTRENLRWPRSDQSIRRWQPHRDAQAGLWRTNLQPAREVLWVAFVSSLGTIHHPDQCSNGNRKSARRFPSCCNRPRFRSTIRERSWVKNSGRTSGIRPLILLCRDLLYFADGARNFRPRHKFLVEPTCCPEAAATDRRLAGTTSDTGDRSLVEERGDTTFDNSLRHHYCHLRRREPICRRRQDCPGWEDASA